MSFLAGNMVVLTAEIRSSGALVDPDTVVLKVRLPDATVSEPEVVRDDIGQYHADVVLGQPGRWFWRWETTGAYIAASEGTFVVTPGNFTE